MTAAPAVEADIRPDIPPVEVDNISVRFGAIKALSEVSFTVQPGTIHAIIGPNGAGKSTMFNVLSGVYKAAEGQVRFGEHRLDQMRPHQIAGIGVARAFQNIALSAGQTVAENLMLGRHHLTKAGFLAAGLRLPRATREGKVHGDARGRDRRVPRARQEAAHARRRAVLRRPEARRGGAGALHRAAAAPARRAGRRHERRGDPPHGGGDPRDPVGAGHLGRARRARHGHGHVPGRPGHRARLRTADRRRHPGRGAGRPRGHPGLPRLR